MGRKGHDGEKEREAQMRVRAKNINVVNEHEVIDEGHNFYIDRNMKVLPKRDYELVPTERWVDVTAECEYDDGVYGIRHQGRVVSTHYVGYRLRKVQLYNGNRHEGYDLRKVDAFIIEKRD